MHFPPLRTPRREMGGMLSQALLCQYHWPGKDHAEKNGPSFPARLQGLRPWYLSDTGGRRGTQVSSTGISTCWAWSYRYRLHLPPSTPRVKEFDLNAPSTNRPLVVALRLVEVEFSCSCAAVGSRGGVVFVCETVVV